MRSRATSWPAGECSESLSPTALGLMGNTIRTAPLTLRPGRPVESDCQTVAVASVGITPSWVSTST
jgi:hypothetical protein